MWLAAPVSWEEVNDSTHCKWSKIRNERMGEWKNGRVGEWEWENGVLPIRLRSG